MTAAQSIALPIPDDEPSLLERIVADGRWAKLGPAARSLVTVIVTQMRRGLGRDDLMRMAGIRSRATMFRALSAIEQTMRGLLRRVSDWAWEIVEGPSPVTHDRPCRYSLKNETQSLKNETRAERPSFNHPIHPNTDAKQKQRGDARAGEDGWDAKRSHNEQGRFSGLTGTRSAYAQTPGREGAYAPFQGLDGPSDAPVRTDAPEGNGAALRPEAQRELREALYLAGVRGFNLDRICEAGGLWLTPQIVGEEYASVAADQSVQCVGAVVAVRLGRMVGVDVKDSRRKRLDEESQSTLGVLERLRKWVRK